MNSKWLWFFVGGIYFLFSMLYGCVEDTSNTQQQRELTVMTYNVLCSYCDRQNYDPWDDRVDYFADIVKHHNPDLIGFQELLYGSEVEQISDLLDDKYGYLYFHDPNGPIFEDYADATIFYKKDEFQIVDHGYYWLSETPDEPWTTGWADVQLWRLVNWAQIEFIDTGERFFFASTHFDNNSPNQEMSAPIVVERTKPFSEKMPVILVGDFNSRPDSNAYEILTSNLFTDSFAIAKQWVIDTNQNPIPNYDTNNRIDHIFLAGDDAKWDVPVWTVDMHIYGENNRYPSDHFPIVARLKLNTTK